MPMNRPFFLSQQSKVKGQEELRALHATFRPATFKPATFKPATFKPSTFRPSTTDHQRRSGYVESRTVVKPSGHSEIRCRKDFPLDLGAFVGDRFTQVILGLKADQKTGGNPEIALEAQGGIG